MDTKFALVTFPTLMFAGVILTWQQETLVVWYVEAIDWSFKNVLFWSIGCKTFHLVQKLL